MRLVIHDLSPKEWDKIRSEYADDRIISDTGTIHPCIGCFSCWNKTPGQCIVRDGYENMGRLIHHADEVIVISRYTYGGFSGFVKNVFDRSLGYVLPQFEVTGGETHHQKRYAEDKPFTFIFRGHDLSLEDKNIACRYVKAVCTNIRGHIKTVQFTECEEPQGDRGRFSVSQHISRTPQAAGSPGKTVLLIGSMRSDGNSAKLAAKLGSLLHGDFQIIQLKMYLENLPGLCSVLESAEKIVICTPLYVDGLPAQVIRFMETAQEHLSRGSRKIYVLANMGLYESSQLENLFTAVRQWSGKMNYDYCGGLGISAGELIGTLMGYIPFHLGPSKKAAKSYCHDDNLSALSNLFSHP